MDKRIYGLDMLRMLLMYMVCISHTLGQGGILYTSGTDFLKYKLYLLIEIISYCAVNAFAMLSGYVTTNASPQYKKISKMWFQAIFYSLIITLMLLPFNFAPITRTLILSSIFPVIYNDFWYLNAYFVLLLFVPFINKGILKLSKNDANKLFLIIIIFAFIEFIGGSFKSFNGYSPLWIIICYIIGTLIKKTEMLSKQKTYRLLLLFILSTLVTWVVTYMNFYHINLMTYISPTIVLNSLILIELFSRVNVTERIKKTVSKLSPLVFGVYLLQMNPIIYNYILKDAFKSIVSKSIPIGIILTLLISLCIFAIGIVVEFIRTKLYTVIKIDNLINRIGNIVNNFLKNYTQKTKSH